MELKNSALNIESREALVKTAWALGATEVMYTNGQINSELVDYNWYVKQDLGTPFYQSSVSNFMKLMVARSEAEQQLVSWKIELETSLAYFDLVWRQERFRLIQQDFLQYESATKIANLKYQTGESNLLSKVMMEAKYEDLRLLLQQAKADKVAGQQNLMKVLQSSVVYEADLDTLSKINLDYNLDSIFSYYERSAMMNYLNKGLLVSEQNIKVQKSSISPRFGFGYFNQSIDKNKGFDGWELNMSFPLWFRPNRGQIQSAKIQFEMFHNTFQQQRFSMKSDLKVLNNQRNTLIDKIETYERISLKNANLIMENADILYRNGEIEYLEYIRSIGQAITMKLTYLDNLNEYNRVTLKMNYIIK